VLLNCHLGAAPKRKPEQIIEIYQPPQACFAHFCQLAD
jgi:hypothetical protein